MQKSLFHFITFSLFHFFKYQLFVRESYQPGSQTDTNMQTTRGSQCQFVNFLTEVKCLLIIFPQKCQIQMKVLSFDLLQTSHDSANQIQANLFDVFSQSLSVECSNNKQKTAGDLGDQTHHVFVLAMWSCTGYIMSRQLSRQYAN